MKNQVDYNEGEMKETHNPSDLALRVRVFWFAESNGDVVYTRDGQFYINDGVMVNSRALIFRCWWKQYEAIGGGDLLSIRRV